MAESQVSSNVYLGGFVLVWLLGSWILDWVVIGRDPKKRRVWGPRLTLLQLCLLASPVVALLIYTGSWLPLLFGVAILGLFVCWFVGKTRTCESCGMVAQPLGLIKAAQFCPSCGEAVSPSPLQRRLGG